MRGRTIFRCLAWAGCLTLLLVAATFAGLVYYLGFVRHCGPFMCTRD
jgi:hypothetical protein